MAKVRFETEEFEFSHGRKPKGYGLWMAETEDGNVIEFTGTLTDLRKYIAELYKNKGQKIPMKVKILP